MHQFNPFDPEPFGLLVSVPKTALNQDRVSVLHPLDSPLLPYIFQTTRFIMGISNPYPKPLNHQPETLHPSPELNHKSPLQTQDPVS
mmetsp:Transcript_8667/g.13712  ORF Transcript_8667/g.13712 Transcript_8667/m.13712 type:complete len:87 (-) Transcript_8667:59-319(-)